MNPVKEFFATVFTMGLFVTIAVLTTKHISAEVGPIATPQISVFFSPKGGCTDAIVREVGNAKKSVLVQAYSFTSAEIAKSLLEAQKRHVSVEVLLDKSQETEKYSSATFFHNQEVPLLIDDKHAIAHNKIIIIDNAIVVTGSFNFTKAAEEKNAENLIIIRNAPDVVNSFVKNFQEHKKHSREYRRAEK